MKFLSKLTRKSNSERGILFLECFPPLTSLVQNGTHLLCHVEYPSIPFVVLDTSRHCGMYRDRDELVEPPKRKNKNLQQQKTLTMNARVFS